MAWAAADCWEPDRRSDGEHVVDKVAFEGGPEPGEPFPDFELRTVAGERIQKGDYVGRPLIMQCASITCPVTRRAGPALRQLYNEYGDQVAFLTLYIREASPEGRYSQPHTFEQKLAHARDYQYRERVPWVVGVDDLDGTWQEALGISDHAVYVMAPDGTVAFRTTQMSNEQLLRETLNILAVKYSRTEVLRKAPRGFARLAVAYQSLPAPTRAAVGLTAGLLTLAIAAAAAKVLRPRHSAP